MSELCPQHCPRIKSTQNRIIIVTWHLYASLEMKIDFIEQAAHAGVVNPEEYIPVELIEDIDTSLQNFFDLYDGLDRMKQLQSECSNPVPNALGRVLMENLPASDGTDIDRRIQFIFMNAEECGHPGVRALHEGLPEL